MKILGIDTSTSCGSIGLVEDEQIISEYILNLPVTHSERLLGCIEYVLQAGQCSLEEIDGWAICIGPGSFTGLRIGVSTVKGLAFASGKPIAGVPSLDILAFSIAPTPYLICPVLDARKKEVYTAFYRYGRDGVLGRLSPFRAVRPEDLVREIEERTIFVGNGVRTYRDLFRDSLRSLAALPPEHIHLPHGAAVARMGLDRFQKKEFLDLAAFAPIYVRPSEAELKWKEKYPSS